ncbi:MAG TPA: type I-C CRISPR-associated protein Cas5c [Blastocatellia bacterium]|nr:type I-C CRISPR-associated protein Cas5c [Blastocatellia bacterium]
MNENKVTIRVWGDFACFTRPEMKVERVSYPVMTPSAARGILEAIFWEPQIYYVIDSIRVVKRGRWVSFRRNEVISRISIDSAKTWMKSPEKLARISAGGGAADGTQRNTLALEGVEYIITAEVRLSELGSASGNTIRKYLDEIERRARSGKCFHRPALGLREFAADFDWEADAQRALERRAAELGDNWSGGINEDIGLMLYDVFDADERKQGFRWLSAEELAQLEVERAGAIAALPKSQRKAASKEPLARWEGRLIKPRAAFFHARVKNSTLDCHPERVKILNSGRN